MFEEALQQGDPFRIRGSSHAFFGAHLIHAGTDELNGPVNQDCTGQFDEERTQTSPMILSESQIWRHRRLGIRQTKFHKPDGMVLR